MTKGGGGHSSTKPRKYLSQFKAGHNEDFSNGSSSGFSNDGDDSCRGDKESQHDANSDEEGFKLLAKTVTKPNSRTAEYIDRFVKTRSL